MVLVHINSCGGLYIYDRSGINNINNVREMSKKNSDNNNEYDLTVKVPFKTKRYKMKVISEVSVCEICGEELYKKDGKNYCTWCMTERQTN